MKSFRIFLAAASLVITQWVSAAGPYSYNANSDEVTDTQTGLVWRRCSEGETWSGSNCIGTAATYTHPAALARAQTQTGWRLPNVKELASITDKGKINPAIDTTAFQVTVSRVYWSSSPVVRADTNAWAVNFYNGSVSYGRREGIAYVRLVR